MAPRLSFSFWRNTNLVTFDSRSGQDFFLDGWVRFAVARGSPPTDYFLDVAVKVSERLTLSFKVRKPGVFFLGRTALEKLVRVANESGKCPHTLRLSKDVRLLSRRHILVCLTPKKTVFLTHVGMNSCTIKGSRAALPKIPTEFVGTVKTGSVEISIKLFVEKPTVAADVILLDDIPVAPGKRDHAESLSTDRSCCVCLDADMDMMFAKCGHLCVCSSCYAKVDACPLCRTRKRPSKDRRVFF